MVKRMRINPKKFLVFLAIFAAAICVLVFAFIYFHDRPYHDEDSFKEYAAEYVKSLDGKQEVGEEESETEYGEPVSTFVSIPKLEVSAEDDSVEKVVKNKAESFKTEQSDSEDARAALLIAYESYETPEKAIGVAIHERQVLNADTDEEEIIKDSVTCFNFSTESGMAMTPNNIFKGDYESIAIEKIKDEADDKYSGKIEKADLTNFVMTDKGFRFFLEPGTMAAKSKGLAYVDIDYNAFEECLRDDIGERVIDPEKPMVAVTYDDGPGEATEQILDIYEENKAVCTFFELGQNVEEVENADELLKRELELGCEIGTHTYSHPNLFTLSDDEIKTEAEKSIDAIYKASGQKPTIFRAPYGNGNDKIAGIFDLPGINWSDDSLDWKSKNAQSVISEVKSHSNLDGQIILMHSLYQSTADASKELVPWLISEGYQLVTVSELLEYKYGTTPEKGKYYGYTFMELGQNEE